MLAASCAHLLRSGQPCANTRKVTLSSKAQSMLPPFFASLLANICAVGSIHHQSQSCRSISVRNTAAVTHDPCFQRPSLVTVPSPVTLHSLLRYGSQSEIPVPPIQPNDQRASRDLFQPRRTAIRLNGDSCDILCPRRT